ncbi:hypothetical protein KUCAC02_006637 [Chaenocephalus aceratus]|uniref:Uncharacterized protein n=1 Tax=Chaenocephalus aceratus TaxID=36190 RepID=A0ACB9VTK3_CHAAC|nr:hypothetical protein KUCAC02_006637 [Chaenocephalus aceratus]
MTSGLNNKVWAMGKSKVSLFSDRLLPQPVQLEFECGEGGGHYVTSRGLTPEARKSLTPLRTGLYQLTAV